MERNPFNGIGKSEPLKGELSSFWSRRIDNVNRLVYRINGDILEILQDLINLLLNIYLQFNISPNSKTSIFKNRHDPRIL